MPEFIQYASQKVPNCFILLTTNGDLLTQSKLEWLLDNGASKVAISCHDEETLLRFATMKESLHEGHRRRLDLLSYFQIGDGTKSARITNRGGAIDLADYADGEVIEANADGCSRVELNIDYLGNVHPCCMDFEGGYIFGNVKNTPLIDIWRETREQFRQHYVGDYR